MNSDAMKKSVYMFLQYGVGGAERMTLLIGKLLDRDKFDVNFVLIKKQDYVTPIEDFIPAGYPVEVMDGTKTNRIIRGMIKILRAAKPDIVFSSVLFINNKLLPLKVLFPATKFIIRCENYLYTFRRTQKIMIKCLYRLADAIIAQTEEMREELVEQLGISCSKVSVLHNPIDKELIEQRLCEGSDPYPQDGKRHLVASGRFAYQKGFDLLVKAFGIVYSRRTDVEMYILGNKDGGCAAEYDRVCQIIKQSGLENVIHCIGFQKNPYIYVKYADVFVLSSRWEGLPNVLIEALYLGTPAAAFKCIPIVERIVDCGSTGFTAECEDINSLAEAIIRSLSLGRIKTTYRSSSPRDFVRLFESQVN